MNLDQLYAEYVKYRQATWRAYDYFIRQGKGSKAAQKDPLYKSLLKKEHDAWMRYAEARREVD